MVLVQNWPIINLFSLANLGKENVFYDILNRKNTILRYKRKEAEKVENLRFFQRGYFGPKLSNFQSFFIRQSRPGKCVL